MLPKQISGIRHQDSKLCFLILKNQTCSNDSPEPARLSPTSATNNYSKQLFKVLLNHWSQMFGHFF